MIVFSHMGPVRIALVAGLLFALARPVSATTIISFSGDTYQQGTVTYSISGNTLTITLANTAIYSTGKVVPSDVLTGVIFTLPTGISLVPVTATVAAGSTLVQTSTCNPGPCSSSTTNMAGEYGYQTAPFSGEGAPSSPYNAGIGSAGQVVGNGTQFPGGTNLDDPINLNGLNFGIVGANYTTSLGNAKVQSEPLINNAVTFTLTIVGGTLLENQITNWALVFGTDWIIVPSTPPVPDTSVPEPSTLLLLGSGFTALAATLRRQRHSRQLALRARRDPPAPVPTG